MRMLKPADDSSFHGRLGGIGLYIWAQIDFFLPISGPWHHLAMAPGHPFPEQSEELRLED